MVGARHAGDGRRLADHGPDAHGGGKSQTAVTLESNSIFGESLEFIRISSQNPGNLCRIVVFPGRFVTHPPMPPPARAQVDASMGNLLSNASFWRMLLRGVQLEVRRIVVSEE
mmetsp:Transcript_22173/g.55924  ORF Transcript_22173/g.55924 Transcript_22173/m.55924 type:complete len:113 (-) Transcript_22173:258-596(-)